MYNYLISLSILILCFIALPVYSNPCTLYYTANSTIDLRPLQTVTIRAYLYDNATRRFYNYTLSPCGTINETCNGRWNSSLCSKWLNGTRRVEQTLGLVRNLTLHTNGFTSVISNSSNITNTTNGTVTYLNVNCDRGVSTLVLDTIHSFKSNGTTYYVASARSRHACPVTKPSLIHMCANVSYGNCSLHGCCYTMLNDSSASCFTNYGVLNVTKVGNDNSTLMLSMNTFGCGYTLMSSYYLAGSNNYYSGSTFFYQGSSSFYSTGRITFNNTGVEELMENMNNVFIQNF